MESRPIGNARVDRLIVFPEGTENEQSDTQLRRIAVFSIPQTSREFQDR